jgi:hypothetical protein
MAARPAFQYGMLTLILALLALNIGITIAYPFRDLSSPTISFIVCSMLLLNHLAWSFWFGPKTSPTLRIIANAWVAIGIALFIYIIVFR